MSQALKFTPTIRRLGENMATALNGPKLCVFNFPNQAQETFWLPLVVQAVVDAFKLEREEVEPVEVSVGQDNFLPLERLSQEVGGCKNLNDFFDCCSEGYLFLLNSGGLPLPDQWVNFIQNVAAEFKHADSNRYYPKILLSNHCSEERPRQLQNSPVIAEFSLWNPVTWEEMRLLTNELIADESNEIRKAWMTCTYAGASNFDYKTLCWLAEKRPKSIEDVIETVSYMASPGKHSVLGAADQPIEDFGREWHLPARHEPAWKRGEAIGAHIERGQMTPWSALSAKNFESQVKYFIWREQVTGLFALLVEIGRRTNEKLFIQRGSHWIDHIEAAVEPGKILENYPYGTLGPMPKNINILLDKLRRSRNHLAHLVPVELTALEQIRDLDLRISAGQY